MKRLVAILLSLVALTAAQPSPAPAAAAVPPLDPGGAWTWPSAPCATGEMTAQSSPGRVVGVSGWIEPCPGAPAPATARYAIVYFGPAGGAARRGLAYAGPTVRTAFDGELNTKRPDSLPVAACLAFSPTALLSCVSIDETDDPALLDVAPIPVDDARLAVPVLDRIRPDAVGWPYCGTCL